MWNQLLEDVRRRFAAVRSWSAPHLEHVRAAAPWKRIGIGVGGAFAVLVVSLVLFLTFADWNALRPTVARFVSAASGREVRINGDLDVRPWSLTPEVRVGGLEIGNLSRFRDRGRFAGVRQADVAVRLLPLLIGRIDIERIRLDGADVALYRNANGQSNWQGKPGRPFNLPAIRQFVLRDGRLSFDDDVRHMKLNAVFNSEENLARRQNGLFQLTGGGVINGQPFRLEAQGAALLNVRRDRPYNFSADVRAGATHLVAHGAVLHPFDLAQFSADVDARGDDIADLYYLLGLALPNTPPYHLTGRVARSGDRYDMTQISGRVGDSDMAGRFSVTRRNNRPYLDANLRSRRLDWDDLMTVFGSPPDTHETASPTERAEAAQLASQGRILPDARLDISRVRKMDAHVQYAAAHIQSPHLPLRAATVTVTLDNGLLRAEPMTFDLDQGRITGTAEINARRDTPWTSVDLRLTHGRVEPFIPVANAISGSLAARIRLQGSGASVREAAANANGAASVVIPSGEVREAFAELTGINVTRGLGLLLTKDQSQVGIRCGIADFQVRNGVMNANSIVVDTDTMLITGSGSVSLRDETMHLHIKGDPKEPRLIRVAAPIAIRGRLRSPSIGLEGGRAAGQTGLAALLGTVLAPLAGVLPFIDAGLADDANCSALFEEARNNTGVRPSQG
ncbi:MAG TPA: AsmA family protein [Caulobacterales bacterium]|nr:AsmA family protein [Caulobacterales bacterium]